MNELRWFLLGAIVLVGLLFWESKLERRFRLPRMVAIVLMVLSLLAIITDPKIEISRSRQVVGLLTPGYTNQLIDSLESRYENIRWLQTKHVPESVAEVARDLTPIATSLKFVVGEGLRDYELKQLDGANFTFVPVALPLGITEIHAPPTLLVQRPNRIDGVYRNESAETQLKLFAESRAIDSITFDKPGEAGFSFSVAPKVSGPLNLTLAAFNLQGDTLNRSPLYLNVEEPRRLKIAIRTSFPAAETRFLKNFLTTQKHQLVVRSDISKDRALTEVVNRRGSVADMFSDTFLASQDLFLMDQPSIVSLNRNEKRRLTNAIKEGLGLIVLLDGSDGRQLKDWVPMTLESNQAVDTTTLTLPNSGRFRLLRVNATFPCEVTAIQKDSRGNTVYGYRYMGTGKIGFQTLLEAYQLTLSGEEQAYAQIWSPLLEDVARMQQLPYDFQVTSPFPWVANHPLEFQVVTSGTIPEVGVHGQVVPLIEDTRIDDLFTGRIWLADSAWTSLSVDTTNIPIHVYPPDEWRTVQTRQRMAATAAASRQLEPDQANNTPLPPKPGQSLRWLFFGLFLISAGLLWVSPKL